MKTGTKEKNEELRQVMDNIDLFDKLYNHIDFIREVLYIQIQCEGFTEHVQHIVIEARDRMDIVMPLLKEIGDRLPA